MAPQTKGPDAAQAHWEAVHLSKPPSALSWYQTRPSQSLNYIKRAAHGSASRIIDVGGGVSNLVDHMLGEGYTHLTVLDISGSALRLTRQRLGAQADLVSWVEADITRVVFPAGTYDVWHDRAVFHFLTDKRDQEKYMEVLRQALAPGGHAIIATFALDGPAKCSGLDVARYSPEGLAAQCGPGFALIDSARESHLTPAGARQQFVYCLFRKNA